MSKILQNEIECKSCGDQIYSAYRHDMVSCKCGKVSVDGGQDYLRRAGSLENMIDRSIVLTDETYEKIKEALDWAGETNRNDLGAICAIFRVLRDEGLLKGMEVHPGGH